MLRNVRDLILLSLVAATMTEGEAWARGFGGGHMGGGMRGFAGGGALGGGGFGGGRMAGMAGRMGGLPVANLGGGGRLGGLNPSELAGLRAQAGAGLDGLEQQLGSGGGAVADRLSGLGGGQLSGLGGGKLAGLAGGALAGKVPSDGQLSKFLGIPSDNGLQNLSGETQSKLSQAVDNARSGDGPLSGNLSGETQSLGSRLYDQVKSGDGPARNNLPGETQSLGSRLYDDVRAGDRPFKNFIPGETQKPLSRLYDSIRAGNHPLRPWSPWRIHNNAIIIRRNFNNYFIFTPGWFRRYPAAWYPPIWYYGSPWVWAPWPTLATWCGYPAQPVYYDYGSNVVYQQNSVVVNGSSVGTPQEYADQAEQLAEQGTNTNVSDSEQWMSLGVFAVSQGDDKSPSMVMQLAINKEGVIRGNYDNTATKDTQVIHGAVDKKTLRAAWTIGDHRDIVLDTGIYNLTKEETPVLVHFGDGKTKQWLMVRLDKKQGDQSTAGGDGDGN